jgi:hypothetical protein
MLSSVGYIPGGQTKALLSTLAHSARGLFLQHRGYGANLPGECHRRSDKTPKMMLNLDGQWSNNASQVHITGDT